MRDSFEVAYITDDNYVMPTIVSITSLSYNNMESMFNIYVVCKDVTKENEDLLKKMTFENCNIILIRNESYGGINENKELLERTHVTSTAYLKFLLPAILAQNDSVLYLDGDVIICGSIKELFDISLEGFYLAAVDEMGDMPTKDNDTVLGQRIGIYGRKYFNSGVMLLNLKRMREESISQKLDNYLATGINYFVDQDAFNYILGAERFTLDKKFNFRSFSFYEKTLDMINKELDKNYTSIANCLKDQIIVHFTHKYKPWEYEMQYYTELFKKYYSMSVVSEKKLCLKPFEYTLWNEIICRDSSINELIKINNEQKKKISYLEFQIFPYEKIPSCSRVLIYGKGKIGNSYMRQLRGQNYCEIVAWTDRKEDDYLEIIKNARFDYLLVAIWNKQIVNEVVEEFLEQGICREMIVTREL